LCFFFFSSIGKIWQRQKLPAEMSVLPESPAQISMAKRRRSSILGLYDKVLRSCLQTVLEEHSGIKRTKSDMEMTGESMDSVIGAHVWMA
jgi:hypothetical protein